MTASQADTARRRILVTGASRGIGRATALRLADSGFAVTLHYHSRAYLAEAAAAEITAAGGEADLLQFDVGDRDTTAMRLNGMMEEKGAWYGVVLNAGITADNAFPSLTGDNWDSVIHTNLDGFYNVLNPVIMPMIRMRQGGRIVTLSSVSGLMGNRGQVNYSAAKAGIIGATKALAIELAKRRITVNCVAPGVIETDMTADVPREEALKMIPMATMGKTDDIAAAINFLCSDDAGYITRQVIAVNGGMC